MAVLPAGTQVLVKIDVKSGLFEHTDEVRIPLILKKPVDINLTHGKPNGVYRIADYSWENVKTEMCIKDDAKCTLTPDEGPVASFSFAVQSGH